jgi:hypothetical protein
MWFRSMALFYPYMWKCDKADCYFMVSTNDLTVLQQIRKNHEQASHRMCPNRGNTKCAFADCTPGRCIHALLTSLKET